MALTIWTAHGEEWLDGDKVNFNGTTKEITVNSDVSELNIQDEVYSAWIRWFERDENRAYLPAMRFTGLDLIPGGSTGATFFMINGWKLVYDPRAVSIAGILYSDDYDTPYYFLDGLPVYPATVSAISLSGSSTPINYTQLASAVAAVFAEPEITTAGIAAAIGTVDVDAGEIADEVESRFTFDANGRVAADIDGSKSMKQLKQHVSAAIPTPPAASTIWDAAPKWLKKPVQAKDYSDAIRTVSNKLDGLYQSIQFIQERSQPITPEAFDATGIEREIQNLQIAISAIQMPDGQEGITSLRELVEPLEGRLDALQSEVQGVRENVREMEFPETDITGLATKEEVVAMQSLLKRLSNYDDAQVKQMLESVIASVEALPDEAEVINKKVDMVLDNQMRLL